MCIRDLALRQVRYHLGLKLTCSVDYIELTLFSVLKEYRSIGNLNSLRSRPAEHSKPSGPIFPFYDTTQMTNCTYRTLRL